MTPAVMTPSVENMAYAALALRCFGFIVSLPLGEALSTFPRFFLAVGLAIVLRPSAMISGELTPLSLIVEFVIGFVLGAPLRCIADVSEMIGELVDTARGQTISAVLDPLHGQGNSDLAVLFKNGAIVVALTCGALEVALSGLARSVEVIPLGTVMLGTVMSDESFVKGMAQTALFLIVEGMRICAVWLGAFLLIDLGCAAASRVVSGLSFSQACGVLKMVVTFLLLLVLLSGGGRFSLEDLKHVLVPWKSLASWASSERVSSPSGAPEKGLADPCKGAFCER